MLFLYHFITTLGHTYLHSVSHFRRATLCPLTILETRQLRLHSDTDGDKLCRMQESSLKYKNMEEIGITYSRTRRAFFMSNDGKMSEG